MLGYVKRLPAGLPLKRLANSLESLNVIRRIKEPERGNPKCFDPHFPKDGISHRVPFLPNVMLLAVHLDAKPSLGAIEIEKVVAHRHLLPKSKSEAVLSDQTPKDLFRGAHFAP